MGRLVVEPFKVLTASTLQAALDQGNLVFATAAARDAALTSGVRFVGMISAVQEAPDNGAPRRWDGSAWILVSAGVTNPNLLSTVDIGDLRVSDYALSTAGSTWAQITADLGTDAILTQIKCSAGGNTRFELGTGPSSSEVIRSVFLGSTAGFRSVVFPFGIFVPSGTRIAIRTATGVTNLDPKLTWVTATGTEVEGGYDFLVLPSNNTAWVEVDSAPPKAGGVEVIGLQQDTDTNSLFRLGLGSAGNEVAVTEWLDPDVFFNAGITHIPPFTWPAGTRLAVQRQSNEANTPALHMMWRESLAI